MKFTTMFARRTAVPTVPELSVPSHKRKIYARKRRNAFLDSLRHRDKHEGEHHLNKSENNHGDTGEP